MKTDFRIKPDYTILVDMDRTIADFDSAFQGAIRSIDPDLYESLLQEQLYPEIYPHEKVDIPEDLKTRVFNTPGFWKNMYFLIAQWDCIFNTIHGLLSCDLSQVHFEIATNGPSRSPNAWTEKKEWIDLLQKKYFDIKRSKTFSKHNYGIKFKTNICEDKTILNGHVLIDDSPHVYLRWKHARINSNKPFSPLIITHVHPLFLKDSRATRRYVEDDLYIYMNKHPKDNTIPYIIKNLDFYLNDVIFKPQILKSINLNTLDLKTL